MSEIDYTEGALDIPRESVIAAVLARLGPPQRGNSQFSPENLYDLVGDRRYYALRRPMAERFVADSVEPHPWVKDVCDCDSKTTLFGADSIKGARRLGWKFGLAALWLSYCSKSLGLPHRNRLDGYHQTPLLVTFDEGPGDLDVVVLQPPTQFDGGPAPTKWQRPEDEVKFWVVAGGLT